MNLSEPLQAKRVICTLGVYRSGTSMVSRMLNLLGVHLGAEQSVLAANEFNPKGFWEHLSLIQLNDEILARFGGRWDEPPALPPAWQRDPRLEDIREKARQLLSADFAEAPLWGWKDPRTCITVPFWQDLIGSMRYVICVRNPREVIASLSGVNGMSPEKAEGLWLTHMQSILASTSGQPRMFVFYEDILNDWAPELRRMAAFIGRPERGEDPRVHESVGEFLEKDMRHHRMSIEDLAVSRKISYATKSLYLILKGYAPRETAVDDAFTLDRAGRVIQKTFDLLAVQALETTAAAAMAATATAVAAERDKLAAETAALAVTASKLRREYEVVLYVLREIQSSRAWKLVVRSRNAAAALLPAGTRRREVFDALLHRIITPLPPP